MAGNDNSIPVQTDESLVLYLSRLDATSATLIRIFDRGDFYSVHEKNAVFIANDFLKSPEAIKYIGRGKIPTVSISKLNYEVLLRELLLIKQYRVELHTKVGTTWKRTAKGSPGNLSQFEDILFTNHEMSESSGVACLYVTLQDGSYLISVTFMDVMMKQLSFCDLSDTELFCTLESVLVQISPRECLISVKESNPEYMKLNQILQRLNILVVQQKITNFKPENGCKYLSRLLSTEDGISAKMIALERVMGSFACLVKYLEIMSDESNFGQFELTCISPNSYMRLDSAAFTGLNIMPKLPTDSKFSSLFGILNNCSTPQGQRLLNKWLKQPLLDCVKITERLDLVEAFVHDSELRQNLAITLKRIPDFYRIAKKLQRGKGKLQDCYKLYMAIKQIPRLLDVLSNYTGEFETTINCKFITPLREFEEDFSNLSDLVETTVDLDMCDTGEFVIKSSFDENLADFRCQLDSINEQIEVEYSNIAKMLNAIKGKTLKLDKSSTYGYCFRVTRKDEKGIRQNQRLEILQTKKDGVLFTSSELKSLSQDAKTIQKSYEKVQSHIVEEVLRVACGYTDPIIHLNHNIAYMDCLSSFAQASCNAPIPYTRPEVLPKGTGIIELTGGRHPCVESNGDITFISNDVVLNKTDSSFLIITGPNMGGKSTYIRQLGVISLLAQIGCFVPCDSAKVSVVSSIFARVGAADSQSKGVSTFMAEMLETSAMLSSADSDSLIIIDELGRGTSTYDGFGLAWGISNYIIKEIKCLAVFATHFHEMTNLENVQPAVKNYHVSALVEADALTLLYQVTRGPCDQSFGLHVARLAEFPEEVMKLATEKAGELDQFQFVPEECLDRSQHSEYIDATALIDKMLGELRVAYQAGSRGAELRVLIDHFIASNGEVIGSNAILEQMINKCADTALNGS